MIYVADLTKCCDRKSGRDQEMKNPGLDRRLSVAPMLDCTDRHYRFLIRLISQHTLLYTEMVTSAAIIHGNTDTLLAYHNTEHPVALQLGGSNPQQLATAAMMGEDLGYDEINLNVGCPSNRVQAGSFGACLMLQPKLVAKCIATMAKAVSIPVTIKHRLGVDNHDSFSELVTFVEQIAAAGCQTFIVHARKAWLKGLSPKQNRTVPPLHYDWVTRLKERFPTLEWVINGGIPDLDTACEQLAEVDGVMIGRAAYINPFCLAEADSRIFTDSRQIPSRQEVFNDYREYCEQQLTKGVKLGLLARHANGLFLGQTNAKSWRRYLSDHVHHPAAGIDVLDRAYEQLLFA